MFVKAIVTGLLAIALVFVCNTVGRLTGLHDITNESCLHAYLKYYYEQYKDKVYDPAAKIVIIDQSKRMERSQIADDLYDIRNGNPAVVVLDFNFDPRYSDSVGSKKLKYIMDSLFHEGILIVPEDQNDTSVIDTADSSDYFGHVYDTVTHPILTGLLYNVDSLLSYKVAQLYVKNTHLYGFTKLDSIKKIDSATKIYTNFKRKDFKKYVHSEFPNFYGYHDLKKPEKRPKEIIDSNTIVFIGDLNNKKDQYQNYFGLSGISGTEYLAYATNSIIAFLQEEENKDNVFFVASDKNLIGIFFSIVYLLFAIFLINYRSNKVRRYKEKKNNKVTISFVWICVLFLIEIGLLFVMEWILFKRYVSITDNNLIIPNTFLFLMYSPMITLSLPFGCFLGEKIVKKSRYNEKK